MIDVNDFKHVDGDPELIEIEFVDDDEDQADEDGKTDAGVDLSDADGDDGSSKTEELQKEIDHLREIYLRKLAEFDNFRKRTDRERVEREKVAGLDVVQDLIPVIDNFERALEHASESSLEALEAGVGMIANQLFDVLVRRGLEIFDPKGEVFDPECHEAIQRVEDSDLPPGTVAWVVAKGFRYGGRLLRPAMVGVVAEKPVEPSFSEPEEGNES